MSENILTSILSSFHPSLTLRNDDLKREKGTFCHLQAISSKAPKRYLFCSWKRCSQKREKGTFFAVGSDALKSAKKVPFLRLEVMLLKVQKSYLFKDIKWRFLAFGKPFKILLIDICHPLAPLELQWTVHRFFF